MFSCTKVEDELGTDFIPVQDMMKLRMDTMKKVYSYTRSVDSIVTDEWGYTYMGSMVQSMFGQTNCDFIGQVVFAGGFCRLRAARYFPSVPIYNATPAPFPLCRRGGSLTPIVS